MQNNNNTSKILSSPAKAEQIIEFCRQKFINILPNNSPQAVRTADRPINSTDNSSISSMNAIYKKQEVKQVMRQLSIFLQLVIQNCLLSSDTRIKTQSYRILGHFRNLLSRDLQDFQTLIYNKHKTKLPFYENDCKDIAASNINEHNQVQLPRQLTLKMPPQVSLYQDPLLFYIYTRLAQQELFLNHPVHVNREQRIEILKNHVPFLDSLFIPIVSQRLQTKAKFTQLEDRLLMILVKSKLQISQYRQIYFPERAEAQIKNRIKNLCGNSKEMANPIKQVRQNQYLALSDSEIQKIVVGFAKYGPRWPVISKYYQLRSAEFLEAQYNDCEKLKKKRQKQGIKCSYSSFRKEFQEKVDQYQKKHSKMDIQAQPIHIIQQEGNDDHKQMEEEIPDEPVYKIINHLTFEYQQI